MVYVYNYTTFIYLNNQSCITRRTLIDINPHENNQGLRYYPFMVNLDNTMEVVILLMIHLVEYVFQIKRET